MHEVYEAIVKFLMASDVPFTIHEHNPSYTVADAGERLPFPAERLLKTIAFKTKVGGYILAGVRGPDRVDYRLVGTNAELINGKQHGHTTGSVFI